MQRLLRIQSSLFNGQGQSSGLVDSFVKKWQTENPGSTVVTRDLAENPVPHLNQARFQAFLTPPADQTAEQRDVVNYSDTLIQELKDADVIVFGIPMYNFNVPSGLQAWFDHIARAGITFRYTANGPEGLIKGKKVYVIFSRGGIYGEEHSQSRFVRQILSFIGLDDVEFIYAEGLAMGDTSKADSLAAAELQIAQLFNVPENAPQHRAVS